MKRALVMAGGWEDHAPAQIAEFATTRLLDGFDVTRADDVAMFDEDALAEFDLLVPIWTFGSITEAHAQALSAAVAAGLGLVAWHGFASAFLTSRLHKHILGGQFVAHPGGDGITYDVEMVGDAPFVAGLADVTVTSEQYYLLVDPAVEVLATTTMVGDDMPWLAGVEMPVAWRRSWGEGRVFYCSLGHTIDVLAQPTVTALYQRAMHWAARLSGPCR